MKCPDEGTIQAYLDGELSREERKQLALHLEECGECRSLLDELSRLEQWAGMAIGESLPPGGEELHPIDVDRAWRRFEQRIRSPEALEERDRLIPSVSAAQSKRSHPVETIWKRSWRIVDNRYKKWLSGAAAVAVLCGSLAFPEVRAAAKDLLSVFRMEKTEMISLTDRDLRQIEGWLSGAEEGIQELPGIGTFRVENREIRFFDRAETAEQAGIKLPQAPDGFRPTHVISVPEWSLHVQLNVDKANRLLQKLQAGVQFDPALDGKEFTFTLPAQTETGYEAIQPGKVKSILYSRGKSPFVQAPGDVDLDELRSTFLQLPFIPQDVRKQLADIKDWKHTLPLPRIEGMSEEVTVQGEPGLLFRSEHDAVLIWQKDGELHRLEAWGEQAPETHEMVKIANQFK